jgi:NAD+ synthase
MELPQGLRFEDNEVVQEIIVNFIKEYVEQAGVKGAVLGLSGGIDSSLVAALASRALGPKNILGLIMPVDKEKDTKNISDAKLVAEFLGIPYKLFELKNAVASFDPLNLDRVARGNLAARLRMVTWYAYANQENRLVLGTGNKTELMIGYFTKYGDGGTDILPIGELYKVNVRDLAKHLEIPEAIIKKAPSAGLWEGQTDEGEIGITYPELDSILFLHLEQGLEESEIVKQGIDEIKVRKVLNMIARTQHKRDPLPKPNIRI